MRAQTAADISVPPPRPALVCIMAGIEFEWEALPSVRCTALLCRFPSFNLTTDLRETVEQPLIAESS
jgi:hypothetical protein